MKRNESGYALLISMISLVILTTMTGLLVLSTQSDVRRSRTTRVDLQAHYVAETGLTKALMWFSNNYSAPAAALVNTGASPSFTDPLLQTYSASVSLTSGAPLVLNSIAGGTATTHPGNYSNRSNVNVTNVTTSFQSALGGRTVALGADGSGTFSVMATMIRYSPEVWRIDSVGTYSAESKAVSVWIERLPMSPYIQAAYTSASPVDLTGNQTIDGRDHNLDGSVVPGVDGLAAVAVTNTNPLPEVDGSGEIIGSSGGVTTTLDNDTVLPDPEPAGYPVNNNLDPNGYPATPAGALGLDPVKYQPWLDSRATTTIPCVIQGLVVLNMSFPTGSGGGGCDYSGTGILILHNPRYDPRYFDPTSALYSSSTSPIAGQTAAQYRSDPLNQPRSFNYNANNTFKGIIIADSVGEIGPGITGNAGILGAIISLDRVNGSIGTGNATIGYSTAAISNALNSMPYSRQQGTFRHLTE